MRSERLWRPALIATLCLWAGLTTPAAAQLFGLNSTQATQPAAAATPAETAGKPMELKKYTKRRSRGAKRTRAHPRKAAHHAKKPGKPDHDARQAKARDDGQDDNKTGDTRQTGDAAAPSGKPETVRTSSTVWPVLPSSVANARAELTGGKATADTVFDAAPAVPAAAPAKTDIPATTSVPGGTATALPAGTEAPAVRTASGNAAPAATAAAAGAAAQPAGAAVASADPAPRLAPAAGSEESASAGDTAWSRTSLIGKIFVAFGSLLMLASAARLYLG